MNLENDDLKRAWALLPSYNEAMVNGTLLIFEDHTEWMDVRTVTLEEHLAQEHCLNLQELRRKTGKAVKNMRHMPLIFSRECKFIQIHYRHPQYPYDGAYGIVRADAIQGMAEKEKGTLITLRNNEQIKAYDQITTVKRYLNSIQTALNALPQLQININEFHDMIFKELEIAFKKSTSQWH